MALGGAAAGYALWRREPVGIPLALGYFAVMEGLQAVSYPVAGQCGDPLNRVLAQAAFAHILLHPIVINLFLLSLVPAEVRARLLPWVMGFAVLASGSMLLQMAPLPGIAPCAEGRLLCGPEFCVISGAWHIGWTFPYTEIWAPLEALAGTALGFPGYTFAIFLLPLAYGAWRFVALHVVVGPVLSMTLASDPREWPAVWCLFSVAIVATALVPALRRFFSVQDWPLWPGRVGRVE
jgi:hypothetical protein